MENEFVDAELTYIVDDGKPSIRYVDWPEEKHNERLASYEARQTRIFNGRLLANPPKLDDFGFELLKRRSAVSNFYDETEVKNYIILKQQKSYGKRRGNFRACV